MSSTWMDEFGTVRKTPTIRKRLKFGKIPLHASLRGFVMRRDRFVCKLCGRAAITPIDYDGTFCVGLPDGTALVVDHIISRRCGGSHHPINLQCLCDSCNARKATWDRKQNEVWDGPQI